MRVTVPLLLVLVVAACGPAPAPPSVQPVDIGKPVLPDLDRVIWCKNNPTEPSCQ